MVDQQQQAFVLAHLQQAFPAPHHYGVIQRHSLEIDQFMDSLFPELYSPSSPNRSISMDYSEAHSTVGWVFQLEQPIFLTTSVQDEIATSFCALNNSLKVTGEAKRKALELLTYFNLMYVAERNPFILSQGETKIVWLICQWIKASSYLVISNLQADLSVQHQQTLWSFLMNSQTYAKSFKIKQPQLIVGFNKLPKWIHPNSVDSDWQFINQWHPKCTLNGNNP